MEEEVVWSRTMEEVREKLHLDDGDLTELNIGYVFPSLATIEEFTTGLVNKSCLVNLVLDGVFREFPDALVSFLEVVTPQHPNIRELNLSSNKLTANHMPRVANVIKNNMRNLTMLDMNSNNLGNSGALTIAQALRCDHILEKLILYDCNIGAQGCLAVAEAALEMTALRWLSLHSNSNEVEFDATTMQFVDALAQNRWLQVLDLSWLFNERDPDPISYFIRTVLLSSRPSSLRKLDFSGHALLAEHLNLISHPNLIVLILHFCDIDNEGAHALAHSIQNNKTMEELSLEDNQIGAEGLAVVAMALQTTGITCLRLCGNSLGSGNEETFISLDALAEIPHLEELDIEGVFMESDPVALAYFIRVVLPSLRSLRTLNLSSNHATSAHAVRIGPCIIGDNQTLQHLNLSYNRICDEGCEEIADLLCQNTSLVSLALDHNLITGEGAAPLKECFQKSNYTLEVLDFDEEPMETVLKDIITQNGHLKRAVEQLKNNNVPIPPHVWPRIFALANAKPELLYLVLRSDADIMMRHREEFERSTPDPREYFDCMVD